MARPMVRNWINVICQYCSKKLYRPAIRKRHFCDATCYWSWIREKRPISEIHHKHTNSSLTDELQRVAYLVGHLPTMEETKRHSNIYPSIFCKHFGNWRIALASIVNPSPKEEWNISHVSCEEGGWLAGIADGESTFRLAHPTGNVFTPIWGLQLRADDFFMIDEIKRIMGLSNRSSHFWKRDRDRQLGMNAGDAIRFYIRDLPTHLTRTVPIFDRFVLRSKKKREFPLFAEAVRILDRNHQSRHWLTPDMVSRLSEIKVELEYLKKYDPAKEKSIFVHSSLSFLDRRI